MEDDQKKRIEDDQIFKMQKIKFKQFKNKIVQIGCGSAPGNLVFFIK